MDETICRRRARESFGGIVTGVMVMMVVVISYFFRLFILLY